MNRLSKISALAAIFLLTVSSTARCQEQNTDKKQSPENDKSAKQAQTQAQSSEATHGYVDAGVRFATGDVYGRPDLPFDPGIKN